MENSSIEKGEYQNTKREAKEHYFKIGRAWCPVLNDYVAFNAVGFRHLVRKRGVLRSTDEQLRRFSLIPLAKEILENSNITIFHKKQESSRFLGNHKKNSVDMRQANFWTLSEKRGNKVITVIVRQFNGGAKHFFSVY